MIKKSTLTAPESNKDKNKTHANDLLTWKNSKIDNAQNGYRRNFKHMENKNFFYQLETRALYVFEKNN